MDTVEAAKLLVPLAMLAGLYLKVNKAVRTMAGKGDAREISNDPLKVQETVRPATLEDVKAIEKRVARLEKEFKEHTLEADRFRDKIYSEITDLKDRMTDQLLIQGETLRSIERSVGRLEGPP